MRALCKCLILVGAWTLLWGQAARAQDAAPTPPAPPTTAQADSAGSAGEANNEAKATSTELSDEELVKLSQEETIEIFDERPDKPFDRDTEVRLTGEQLAARGAVDLGTALALLPDVTVRDGGRGGFNIDIRGARKGAVSILIDGVLVTDPFYGTFDVSTIPITDIVQIRMSTTPQSPIDGPGGPGGVVEVLTRDAVGAQIVVARATGDSLPSFGITGTARAALAKHLALRISASGLAGVRDLELPANAQLGEQRRSATGSSRLEYRKGDNRLVVDGFVDDRHYISPPSDVNNSSILMVDRETSARASAKGDIKRDKLQLQGQSWVHSLKRRSRYFRDPTLTTMQAFEDLVATRYGGLALATHPIGKEARWAVSASADHDNARVENIGAEVAKGDVTLIELAASAQYEKKTVRIDAAGGAAIPFGVGADPWPEAKLVVKWKPSFGPLELSATGARKGRVPSLRERYDLANGNPALGPEMVSHGELRASYDVKELIKVEAAPFYKRTTGTVRASVDPADMGMFINLGKLSIYGVDTSARVQAHERVEVGVSYNYVKAHSDETGDDPLDRLPHNRADGWVQGNLDKRFSLLARAKYFGKATDKMVDVPGYVILEATATAQLSKEYLAVLKVDDLLDKQPETRAGYHTAGRVISIVLQGQWE